MDNLGSGSDTKHSRVALIIISVGIFFIAAVLFLISLSDLTSRETTLLGTVLTLLSVTIGGGVSHFYSTQDKKNAIAEIRDFEQRNLRTFALKAAEKVTNLSKELNRLSAYLQEELQYTDYRNSDEALFAKEERIESAIHMLESLRSINDTSLSDWQGVIGEELDERREFAKEQAEALIELGERLNAVENQSAPASPPEEFEEIKRSLRNLAAEFSGSAFRSKQRPNFQHVETFCTSCTAPIKYGQRAKEDDCKAIQCKNCNTNLISRYRESTGFVLTVRRNLSEEVTCPECSYKQSVELDEWPTASTTSVCTSCDVTLRISRAEKGQLIKVASINQSRPSAPLTEELLEVVRISLPEQPWPKGIHQTVAVKLSIKPSTVQKAIQHLIRTNVFMDQVDGVVCTTAEKIEIMRNAGARL